MQGWSIKPIAHWLGLIVPPRHGPVDRIELELPGRSDHEVVAYTVHPESPVAKGERVPRWARPSLVIRDGHSLSPHNSGRPQAGDTIYILTTSDYVALLDRLFAGPTEGAADPTLYGQFVIDPDAPLGDIETTYGAVVRSDDLTLSVRDFLRRELAGDIEQGDRVALGAVDVIVRGVTEEHEIEEVGLSVEPEAPKGPEIPLFQGPRDIVRYVRERRQRRHAAAAPDADEPGESDETEH